MKITKSILLTAFAVSLFAVSCNDDDTVTEVTEVISPLPSFPNSVQISNEDISFGPFATGINGGEIEAATVEGTLNGAHGTYIRIPIGDETVPHIHSNTYHGVVIKGIIENPVAGDTNPTQMGPGSFWYQLGNEEHITRCAANSPEPAVIFIYASEFFDFIPQ